MKKKNLKANVSEIIAVLLIVVMCFTSVSNIAWAAEVTESSSEVTETTAETVQLEGEILSMGYEFNCPKTTLKDTIKISAVCKEDNTVVQMTTSEGEYSLKLKKDKVYTVTYSGYISGRMARMTIPVSILSTGDKKLNLIIRTKNVLGLSTVDEYLEQYPTDSIVIRKLNSGRWFDESLSVEPANVELPIKGEQQLKVNTSSGLIYENGYEYQSSDPSVATVDENGVVTAVGKGSVVITCTMKGEDGIMAESKVQVSNGFDYTKDGFCFPNSVSGFGYEENEYIIPYERYVEVYGHRITKNYYNSSLKQVWGGNCFGMSYVSLLFYYDYLEKQKYAPKCYEEGETINQGFYDKILTSENAGNVKAAILKESELTKLIERYQVWQYGPEHQEWSERNKVSVEDVVRNWNSGKSYTVSIKWLTKNADNEEVSVGHRVVLDMHGDVPIKNENGEYVFLIYDPNYPAFTDQEAENSSQNVYLKVSEKGYVVETVLNEEEETIAYSGTMDDIKFYEVDLENEPLPSKFNGDLALLSKLAKSFITVKAKNIIVRTTGTGMQKLLEIKDFKVVYQADGVELEYDLDASTAGENRFSFAYDSADLHIEMPTGGKCFMLTSNSIDGVVLDGKAEIRTSSEGISVETEEATEVSVLTESHHEDGTITSILADGKSEAGNTITCSLDEKDQYTLKATKKMETNLTLNTEDSNVNKEKAIVAKNDSEKINVVEYVAGEEVTPTPSSSEAITATPTPSREVITATPIPSGATTIATPTPVVSDLQQKAQTITAKNITKTYGNKAFKIGAKTDGDGKLTYTSGNKKVAVVSKGGKVTIKGCGKTTLTIKAAETKTYKAAQKKITLTVKPKKQKISSLKSTKAKTITVKWKKDTKATGYMLQYSTDKNFKKNVKKITISNNKTTSKQIRKLKAGKKYYVRICSYKKSSGAKIKGKYSKVKSVKTKSY